VDGTDGVVIAGTVVVVLGGLVVVVAVGGRAVAAVGELAVGVDGAVVAVVPEVLDAPEEEADVAALTATVPVPMVIRRAIKVVGMRTLNARDERPAARRRAARAAEVPDRLIALPRNGNHARDTCRSSHGPHAVGLPGYGEVSVCLVTKGDFIPNETRVQWFCRARCNAGFGNPYRGEGTSTIASPTQTPGHVQAGSVRATPRRWEPRAGLAWGPPAFDKLSTEARHLASMTTPGPTIQATGPIDARSALAA
jgi:hypothetical protein